MSIRDRKLPHLLAIISLLAFLLRVDGLSTQSLWFDEGLSVAVAQKGLSEILRGGGSLHPPLYHVLLGGWVRLAGTGEFAARYPSLLFAVVLVALGAVLANLLFGPRAGALTGLFLAVSPIEVWYAQEARMYALLGVLTLASSVCLLRLMRGDRRRALWVVYTLVNIAAIYSHDYAALVIVAQAVWVLLHLVRVRDWRFARSWAVAQVATGLAYLPWMPILWQQLQAQDATYWPGTLSWSFVARTTLLGFMGADLSVSKPMALPLAWLVGGLAGLGLLLGLVRRRCAAVLLAIYLLVPSIIVYLLVHTRPKYAPRYLLIVVPPLLVLAGAGVAGIWPRALRRWHEWARVALAVLVALQVAVSSAYAATNVERDPAFGRDDMRGVADYLTHTAGDDEAIILLSGHFQPVFSYYYRKPNCYPIPPQLTPAPDVNEPIGLEVLDDVNHAIEGRRGAWLVLWQDEEADPNGVVKALLEHVGSKEPVQRNFRGVRLEHYIFPTGVRLQREDFGRQPLNADIGQGDLQLISCDLPGLAVPSGGTATVLLYWQALRPISRDYRITLAVTDEHGQELAEGGGRLAGYMYPTDRWRPGALVMARHDIVLPKTLVPGEYAVVARIYPYGIPVGQTVSLGRLQVSRAPQPPVPSELGIAPLLDVPLGTVQLLGCKLSPSEATPGQTVYLTLYWKALAKPAPAALVHLHLGAQPWADVSLPTGVAELEPGDIFGAQYPLIVPRDAADGSQSISLVPDGGGEGPGAPPVGLGELNVHVGKHSFVVPADIRQPRHVDLGGQVTFLGYDLDSTTPPPGATLHLTLYWQAAQPMTTSYTVFVHLLDGQEKIWGQVDSLPVQRTRPTTGWLPGEVLVDTYDIQVSRTAPLGEYVIEIGLYDPATGARLPAYDEAGQHLYADRILLDTIRIGAVGASPPTNP